MHLGVAGCPQVKKEPHRGSEAFSPPNCILGAGHPYDNMVVKRMEIQVIAMVWLLCPFRTCWMSTMDATKTKIHGRMLCCFASSFLVFLLQILAPPPCLSAAALIRWHTGGAWSRTRPPGVEFSISILSRCHWSFKAAMVLRIWR